MAPSMIPNKPSEVPGSNVSTVFKRTEVIGRGKFGIVYKGYHVKTKQVYAIKVLNLDSAEDEVEDVQKEVQFLSSLKQVPNITHYYGSYLNDTKLWVIMEYCAGGSLRTLLRPGKIDEQYIGIIMRELLVALVHIHKDNVIHRDIKAANVLIANDGRIKLCDFGVAAQLTQSKVRRQTMAGTPYWMAPEVIMEGVYYDTKVDIWSLGITTYEIATGNPPYCEVEALRAMQLITKSKPPRLEGRQYSSSLKEFIALCLDEDPKERLSAEELLKTRFIKSYKNLPVSVLQELISRYLIHRDKRSSRDASSNIEEDDQARGDTNGVVEGEDHLDVKWDFDSLSSNEYIMENDINIEAIPEESSHEHFNFAYPDEDMLYQSNRRFFQGTTIGKGGMNVTMNNSTIHALNNNTTYHNSTNLQTRNATGTTNKKSETKASKALQQLFEETDTLNEASAEQEYSRVSKPNNPMHLASHEDILRPATPNSERPSHPDVIKGTIYQSQSTPSLPMLQTNFSQPVIVGPASSTALPTPIEIEIPEELPSVQEKTLGASTKPRSSTVSVVTNKVSQHLQRRLTVTGNGPGRSENGGTPKTILEDKGRVSSLAPAPLSKSGRSSSPMKLVSNGSPGKGPSSMPGMHVTSPSMKPMLNEKTDVLLQPMNGNDNEHVPTRINRDFKKQNPNLKLQMPSPTSLMPNKLLENITTVTANTEDSNINQFGFNTSTTMLPVAMTPVGERPHDPFKRNRSTSNASRSNSVALEGSVTVSANSVASNATTNTSTTNGTPVESAMEPPPKFLQMDMFLDAPDEADEPDHEDRKFLVRRELEKLLRTVEDGLPIMEQALKDVLTKIHSVEDS